MRSPLYDYYDPEGLLTEVIDPLTGERRKATLSDLLPEEEKRGMLHKLASAGGSGLSALGWVLGTPGAVTKGLAALGQTNDERTDARELLRQYGLVGQKDNWRNFATGFAADILLDPLSYMSFGLTGLLGKGARTVTGRAAQKAGLMTDFDLFAKAQGMGRRQAMREKTAGDLLEYARSSGRLTDEGASEKLRALQRFGGSVDETLGRTNQLRILGRDLGAFDLYGKTAGDWLARTADTLGEASKTNALTGPLVRGAYRRFSKDVLDTSGYEQQWKARELSSARRNAESALRGQEALLQIRANESLRSLGLDLNDFGLQQQARYYLEDPAGYLAPPEYIKAFNSPEFSDLLAFYSGQRARAMREAKALGMSLEEYASRAGTEFVPRQAAVFDNPRSPDWPKGVVAPPARQRFGRGSRRLFRVDDTSGRRQPYLDVRGGTRTLDALTTDGDLQARLRAAPDTDVRQVIQEWESASPDRPALYPWLDEQKDGVYTFTPPALPKTHPLAKEIQAAQVAIESADDTARPAIEQELRRLQALVPEAAREAYRDKLYTELSGLLRSLDPQHAATKRGLFSRNVFQELGDYSRRRISAEQDAKALLKLLTEDDAVTREAAESVVGGVNMPAKEALRALGIPNAEAALAKLLGEDNLEGISYSRRFVDDWQRAIGFNAKPEVTPLTQAYDNYTQVFKTLALLFPSRYTRDAYSGSYAALSSNAFNPLDWYAGTQLRAGNYKPLTQRWGPFGMFAPRLADAPEYAELVKKNPKLAEELFLSRAGGQGLGRAMFSDDAAASQSQLREIYPGASKPSWRSLLRRVYNPNRTARQAIYDFMPWRLRNAGGNPNPLLELGDRLAETTDAGNRFGTYLTAIRQGIAPEEAMRLTNLTQVDYGNLSRFEREDMKRFFPFYSYTRGILPYIGENLINQPTGLAGQTVRAINTASAPSADAFVPEHLRQSAAIPLPPALGGQRDGLQRFLTNIDLPFEQAVNLFTPGVGATKLGVLGDTINKTALNIAGQFNPLPKSIIESLTNRQLYSGRQLSDLYSVLEQTGVPGGRSLEQLAMNLPGGSRAIGVYRQAVDQRLDPIDRYLKLLANTVAGIKLSDIDAERTRSLAARQMLNDLLSSTPGVRSYENIVVPEESLAKLTPEQVRQYLLYRVIQSDASRRARERKAQEMAAR